MMSTASSAPCSGSTMQPLLPSKSPSCAAIILILVKALDYRGSNLPSSLSSVKITSLMWLFHAMMEQYLASVTCGVRMR
jgi:hypothetical protein